MAKKDYYKILGISDEEKALKGDDFAKVLKNKYRAIALKVHPDRLHNVSEEEKKKAEEKFKEASEAYEVLSNHREEYDNPSSGFTGGTSNFGGMNMEDIFRHFGFGGFGDFGFDPFGMGGRVQHHNAVAKGDTLRIRLSYTLEEALNGSKRKIKYKRYVKCSNCGGSGLAKGASKKTCSTCGGKGMIYTNNGFMQMMSTCPTCGGKGTFIDDPCPKCNGFGIEEKTNEVEIEIPKGAMDGMVITFQGMGSDAPHGEGIPGDLVVNLVESKHDKFVRRGNDLVFELEVGVVDAILGCDTKVTTLDGKTLTAKVPQGTSEGQQLRFKGYGIPQYGTSNTGSMIAVVKIKVPNKLNDRETELLNVLKNEEHFK